MGEISTATPRGHPDVGRSEHRHGHVDRGTVDLKSSRRLRDLEGARVTIALADGTILKGATLVSSGRGRVSTLWLEMEGIDLFIDRARVLDIDVHPIPKNGCLTTVSKSN